MKKIVIAIILGIIMISCSNDDDQINTSNLIGTWDWVSSSGGITGETTTPESTGTIMTLEFTNTTITRIIDNDLISENTYSIQIRETMSGELKEMLLIGDGVGQIITIEGNSLILTGDCSDCLTSEYVKQ